MLPTSWRAPGPDGSNLTDVKLQIHSRFVRLPMQLQNNSAFFGQIHTDSSPKVNSCHLQ